MDLQKHPFDLAVVPLHPFGALFFGHQRFDAGADPADVLGHLGVDPVPAFTRTALAPAHNASDKISVPVERDVRPTAVALAGVLSYVVVASAEHAGRDAKLRGFDAG